MPSKQKTTPSLEDTRKRANEAIQLLKNQEKISNYEAFVLSFMDDPRAIGKQIELVIAYNLMYCKNWINFWRKVFQPNTDFSEPATQEERIVPKNRKIYRASAKQPESNSGIEYDNETDEQKEWKGEDEDLSEKIEDCYWLDVFTNIRAFKGGIIIPAEDATGPGPDMIIVREQPTNRLKIQVALCSFKYTSKTTISQDTQNKSIASLSYTDFWNNRNSKHFETLRQKAEDKLSQQNVIIKNVLFSLPYGPPTTKYIQFTADDIPSIVSQQTWNLMQSKFRKSSNE